MQIPEPRPEQNASPAIEFRFSPNPNKANRIDWRTWSDEAFMLAERQRKPLFLSISAVWCHWCHVMDETTLSDENVIEIINRDFIPVRVDADKRPDIQNRYLMGGWPTVAILTQTGDVLTGGTYMPAPNLLQLLSQASSYYEEHYDELLDELAGKRLQMIETQRREPEAGYSLQPDLIGDVIATLRAAFDPQNGGFQSAPKFPNPPAIELLLRRAYLQDDNELLEMALITLDKMSRRGIYDKEWGGFFRYATKADWNVPHYEKMLVDNAGIISNYIQAYQISGRIEYRRVIEDSLRYVDSILAIKPSGGFAGSQDAVESFYQLNAEERAGSPMPYVDPVIYIDANARMISTYCEAFAVLANQEYRDFALQSLRRLLDTCYSQVGGMAHYYDDSPHYLGLLADQAYMMRALIDAYNVAGDNEYLNTAVAQARFCLDKLQSKGGACYDRVHSDEQNEAGALYLRWKPVQENAVLARQLHRLAYLIQDDWFEQEAGRILSNLELGALSSYPPTTEFALALDEILTYPVILTVIATEEDGGAILRSAWRNYIPGKEIKLLDPVADYEQIEAAGFSAMQHPALFPCIGTMCLPPVDSPSEFENLIEKLPGRLKTTA